MLQIILQLILLLHLKSIHVARSSSTYQLYTPRPRHEIFGHSLKCLGASVPVNSQNASNTNSSTVYISGGSEILPHNCIIQCYTDYRKYIVYTNNVNSMSWPYLYILPDCVYVYLAFAAQSHVLWNCIFHTSLTLDLVLRPNYSFIVHV